MDVRTYRADALLLLTATIWGFAFVAQRVGMDYVGPFTFNGVRFALGSLSLVPLLFLMERKKSPASALVPQAGELPFAAGAKLANPELTVVAVGGDGTWSVAADRIVRSGRKDVTLGLLPAGGGTQRVVERVGLVAALPRSI